MNKKRIVIQAYNFGSAGGMGVYIGSLLNRLTKKKNLEITVLAATRKDMPKPKGYKLIQVPFSRGRLSLVNWAYSCRKILLKLHKERGIDLINIHAPPYIPAMFTLSGIRYVVTVHNPHYAWVKNLPYKLSAPDRFVRILLEKRLLAAADHAITLTPDGKQALERIGFASSRISIIPNGTDTSVFVAGMKSKDFDVLFCGRLEPMKGSRSLIQVCNRLLSKRPDLRICIVGTGVDFDLVRSQLSEHIHRGNVKMTGRLAPVKVLEFYQRSKVYVSTSYTEGLPTTCLEAMSCKLPVVGWRLSYYEGLVDDKITGYLSRVDDIDKMTFYIDHLCQNPKLREKMGKRARKIVEERYDWRSIAPKILDVFEVSR